MDYDLKNLPLEDKPSKLEAKRNVNSFLERVKKRIAMQNLARIKREKYLEEQKNK